MKIFEAHGLELERIWIGTPFHHEDTLSWYYNWLWGKYRLGDTGQQGGGTEIVHVSES